ncbi:MAG TPA: pyridoxal phosphate-dependent aminotransferase [Acidimicrobiales bacterium]|nr:pyridoxal phosphate-dependent aminotransferase [Acidimicrobiales bacterium]
MTTASSTTEVRRISRRAAAVAPSATLAVDAKAKALQAAGEHVIGFGAGEPDFPTPAHIVEAAVEACRDPANHHYTPTGGIPALREAIAAKTKRDSGFEVAASQVLVSNGGKQAVANAFAVLCDPGDEVIVLAPYWTTYPESIQLAGGTPVFVESDETTGFRSSVDDLEAAWTPNTKALLFVSPSNPTGAVYPRDEIEAIGRWALAKGIWVLTDEIYEHLVYGGAEHHSMPVLVPELADRCLVANGVAKTYAMTGWRVGWLIGPADAISAATNIQSHETSNVSNVAQRAALAAVSGGLEDVAAMRQAFDRRRKSIVKMLNDIDGVVCPEPEGAFYAFPSVKELLGKSIRGQRPQTSAELAELCITEAKVAAVPGEAFGAPGFFRMSYALADHDISEGVSRLADLFAEAQD